VDSSFEDDDAEVATINEVLIGMTMTRVFLAGAVALFLATGATYSCAWPCNDEQRARAGWPVMKNHQQRNG